jgi:argininosuccinate synthase
MKKIVLAYSGGLDTSYCAAYLSNQQYEVHAVCVNTGGFDAQELAHNEKTAKQLGVKSYTTIEATEDYYQQVIKYLIFGNVLKNNCYPLSVSSERIVQAIAIANFAKKIGASHLAHGSTGAGNDQVRFDMIFQTLAPELTIITPIRDLQLTRQEEIDYLKKQGIHLSWNKAQYSINKGLWGTSIGGKETLNSRDPLPEEAYTPVSYAHKKTTVTLSFENGELSAIDQVRGNSIDNIKKLNSLALSYGIGRDIHVGDTIVGLKGRVGFEAPAAVLIIRAHHQLEKHVLSKWQLQHKDQLANYYGMHLHEGDYLDPVMRDLEAFLTHSQQRVTGEVYLELHPYRFTVNGISSPFDLMNSRYGIYGEMNTLWTAEEAKGFIKINANQHKIHQQVKQ